MWFFFQAEDGIRDLVRSRGLGDVYKRQRAQQAEARIRGVGNHVNAADRQQLLARAFVPQDAVSYTHPDAADERSSVDLGGRRIIKKKKRTAHIKILSALTEPTIINHKSHSDDSYN